MTGDAPERWAAETEKASWARTFERGVRGLFDDPELASAVLVAVDCRTTLCRIEVSFESSEAFLALMRLSAERAPLAGAQGKSDLSGNRLVAYVTPAELASES
jgi:hypothetical protein